MLVQNSQISFANSYQRERTALSRPVNGPPENRRSVNSRPTNDGSDRALVPANPEPSVAVLPATGKPSATVPGVANAPLQLGRLDAKTHQIKLILEAHLGRRLSAADFSPAKSENNPATGSLLKESLSRPGETPAAENSPPARRVDLTLRESEKSAYAINAVIETQSGQIIEVSIEQTMVRSQTRQLRVSELEAARLIDPLVINFDDVVALSDDRVDFDLNGDGEREVIASFASDSAYLALDRNGDGLINDGSELFGVASGDGFADLAGFDEDGNGFIDEGDSIFQQLVLFRPGESQIQSLSSTKVEALYTGKVETPFQLNGTDGELLGQVRSTGFYVTDSRAGTLQQIDLAV